MIRCIVAAANAHEVLASQAVEALRASPQMSLQVTLHIGSIVDLNCDVLLPLVDCDCYPQIAMDLATLRQKHPECGIVALGVGLSEEQLLGLLSLAVGDFVAFPISACELAVRVQRAAGLVTVKGNTDTRRVLDPRLHDLVGNGPAFVRQLDLVPKMAACDATVLILGETGTGKELFAHAIHYLSSRASRPMITVNCGAIPVDLIESELFGHVRGAFTTAHDARVGLVPAAEGGTLFLDEIDSLPCAAQVKLLRFLQDKEYRQVGSNTIRRADVRVIAASNQNPIALVAQGAMRQDLYFRLSVLMLMLPPMRERREDIPMLALYFLQQCCKESKRPVMGLTAGALRQLLAHDWPGNVRELKHVVERAVLMAEVSATLIDDFSLSHGMPPVDSMDESFNAAKSRVVRTFERSFIEGLLSSSNGNISRAAQAAKKDRRAFFELMRKHQIRPDPFRAPPQATKP